MIMIVSFFRYPSLAAVTTSSTKVARNGVYLKSECETVRLSTKMCPKMEYNINKEKNRRNFFLESVLPKHFLPSSKVTLGGSHKI